jgi:exodeoxyribonuclease V gamma subunit
VSCYSELRELQVLHDRLLDMLDTDITLQAHDIVVMCPDINTLAPYVEAVFGQQDENKKIPFSISDNNEMSSSPLLQAILDWIRLPSSRLTANEVLSWLELPALQRRYDLDETAVETIRYWITSNHIHWGLDHTHKQKLGLADGTDSLNTWLHGISRLLTAYIMNDQVELFENRVASETVMSQADYQSLGQLQKFLDDLSIWSKRLSQVMELQQWQLHINELIDTFVKLDDEEEWLVKPLRDEVASWQQQVVQAEFDEALDGTLIHHILQNAISQGSAHHYYLSGGINFCNLIPMRTLPFKVVCLIGMGEDRFPRKEIPLQLDLISINPQKGDRSRREDDRYMFLQSLLSARDTLYISYVGQNKKDDSSIEPSVVVTELLDYIEQTMGGRIPLIKTALQAFSPKNFKQGSYSKQWQVDFEKISLKPFAQPIEIADLETAITIDELINFYKNPAKYFMQQRLNMSLNDYAEGIQDDEIFTLDPLQKYSLNAKLLTELFENGNVQRDRYLNSGELAELNSGVIQYEENYQQVNDDYLKVSTHTEFSGINFLDGNIKIEQVELSGRVASFSNKGLLQINQSRLKGKHIFSYWIQHCFLCALDEINFCEFYYKDQYKNVKLSGFQMVTVEQARVYLQQLIEGFNQGRNKALEFYVDTSYEYEIMLNKKNKDSAVEKIKSLWQPDDFNPFYEAEDIYLKTSLKNSPYNAENFSAEFFVNSSRYMSPLVENILEDKK